MWSKTKYFISFRGYASWGLKKKIYIYIYILYFLYMNYVPNFLYMDFFVVDFFLERNIYILNFEEQIEQT